MSHKYSKVLKRRLYRGLYKVRLWGLLMGIPGVGTVAYTHKGMYVYMYIYIMVLGFGLRCMHKYIYIWLYIYIYVCICVGYIGIA